MDEPLNTATAPFGDDAVVLRGMWIYAVALIVALSITVSSCSTSNPPSEPTGPPVSPASRVVLAKLIGVSASLENTVAISASIAPPSVAYDQPLLVGSGKPGVLFIGGEFCPFCAAERWGLILALSRFGAFSGLKQTSSSPWDTDPSTATFSFYGATYKSAFITFVSKEVEANDTTGPDTHKSLEPLNSRELTLWTNYTKYFGLSNPGFPFIDIGNKVFILHPSYDPATLAGLSHNQIVAQLTDPTSQVTQSIVGTASYLTGGICAITNQQPQSTCGQSAVVAAERALGLL